MKVTRLDGALLDFWVAKSEGLTLIGDLPADSTDELLANGFWHPDIYHPSSDWSQGGGIVANQWYELEDALNEWFGPGWPYIKAIKDEPLKWLMRAYVATKFGEEVEEIDMREYRPTPLAEDAERVDFQPAASARRWPSWFGRSRGGSIRGY